MALFLVSGVLKEDSLQTVEALNIFMTSTQVASQVDGNGESLSRASAAFCSDEVRAELTNSETKSLSNICSNSCQGPVSVGGHPRTRCAGGAEGSACILTSHAEPELANVGALAASRSTLLGRVGCSPAPCRPRFQARPWYWHARFGHGNCQL